LFSMAAAATYRTWLGTQGRLAFMVEEEGKLWKPPPILARLDAELPDAFGHVVMHLPGRGAFTVMIFELPQKPKVYFQIVVSTVMGATDTVTIYGAVPPTEDSASPDFDYNMGHTQQPLARVKPSHFANLRLVEFEPEAMARAKEEALQRYERERKGSWGCVCM